MRRTRATRRLLGEVGYWKRRAGEVQRALEAKAARVEWQSGGIRMLYDRIAVLEARLAMLPAMVDNVTERRLASLEMEQAMHMAEHGMTEEVPDMTDETQDARLAVAVGAPSQSSDKTTTGVTKRPRGRPPIGERPMTGAERMQRSRRLRQEATQKASHS